MTIIIILADLSVFKQGRIIILKAASSIYGTFDELRILLTHLKSDFNTESFESHVIVAHFIMINSKGISLTFFFRIGVENMFINHRFYLLYRLEIRV